MEFNHTTHGQRVVFGTGRAVENVVAQLSSLGLQRVVMIAGSSASGVAEEIGARAPIVARVSEVIQHVPVELVNQAIADATDARADVIVSIGGGSATGLAKAIALTTGLPIIAVPTTFAGSEATDVWGVTTDGRKTTGSDPRVLPAAVIY
ncbi:MAG: iron-containing alcohol dehydrogenase, partial [Microbacteriaceae bacterium]